MIRVRKHSLGKLVVREEQYTVYIGRTRSVGEWYQHAFHELANPYRIGPDGTREDVIVQYTAWLIGATASPTSAQAQLTALAALHAEHGKLVLVCHCHPEACHADVLKEFLEDMAEQREVSKIAYCANDPCETEAIKLVQHTNGNVTLLCYTCSEAFGWGQASSDAEIVDI